MSTQLKRQELVVLKALLENPYHISTTGVAKLASVSWNTAYKYLNLAFERRWINKIQRGNRVYWRAYRNDKTE